MGTHRALSKLARSATALVAAAGVVLAAAPIAAASPTSTTGDNQVLSWTEMGEWGPKANDFPTVMVNQGMTENISPEGTNVQCVPAPGENPVVMIHGMNSNSYQTYARMAPELKAMGKCLYAFNVGKLGPDEFSVLGSIPTMRNMTPLDTALAELTAKIDALKAETGATAVDIVGHSAGGTLAAAYAKQEQGRGIGTVVSLAGVLHGTSLLGISYGLEQLDQFDNAGDKAAGYIVSPSLVDLLQHSEFMAKMNEGGLEQPGVNYVAISTQVDEAVTPMAASQWQAPTSNNILLQDGCSADLSGHIGLTFSPRAIALVANALGRNVEVPCVPVTAVVEGGINDNANVRAEHVNAVSDGITEMDGRIAGDAESR
ncbi:lipase [Corynebacterium amycolatum]|uniref:esterase/lipase family protein n=1 Tax=Corynebacterium amycolatum TaxID=43765 RepID=UPI0009783290|nr:alpha/beta fold hydrolase [Corynebacterium amycolatum]OMQ08356.1 lipase [Corynebacterium amycolatum]